MPADDTSEAATAREVLERLCATMHERGLPAEIYDDDSDMTPMLVVEFDRRADRVEPLRQFFDAEGPVRVDGVYDRRVVVRTDE